MSEKRKNYDRAEVRRWSGAFMSVRLTRCVGVVNGVVCAAVCGVVRPRTTVGSPRDNAGSRVGSTMGSEDVTRVQEARLDVDR